MRPKAEPVTTLLLDLDGTLNTSRKWAQRFHFVPAFISGLKRHGLTTLNAVRLLHVIRLSLEAHRDRELTNRARSIALFAKETGFSIERSEEILMATLGICFDTIRPYFGRNPHALEFVKWARGKFKLILATNPVWPEEITHERIKWAGLNEADFTWVTHSGNSRSAKPQASYYSELVQTLNLDSKSCLMVGNDARKDGPALESKIPVYLVSESQRQQAAWKRDGFLAGDFHDLRRWLEREALILAPNDQATVRTDVKAAIDQTSAQL